MKIPYQDFVGICPSALTPDETIFTFLKPTLEDKLNEVKGIITPPVFELIESIEDRAIDYDYDRLSSLREAVKRYACASAFYDLIPQLDLVMTPNGFGVVSNQNVAPASADRVLGLRSQVFRSASFWFDEMLDYARLFVDCGLQEWQARFFDRLFWRAEHVRSFGNPQPTRDDLVKHIPVIDSAAVEISGKLSPELYRALCVAESTDTATQMQESLITLWRQATVAYSRRDGTFSDYLMILLRFVEDHIDKFPEYRDSSTYKANHLTRYENEKDDSCFFFG